MHVDVSIITPNRFPLENFFQQRRSEARHASIFRIQIRWTSYSSYIRCKYYFELLVIEFFFPWCGLSIRSLKFEILCRSHRGWINFCRARLGVSGGCVFWWFFSSSTHMWFASVFSQNTAQSPLVHTLAWVSRII